MPSARPTNTREAAFTLLELLIVVAIIALLASMVLGALAGARKKTMVARARSEIAQLKAALSMYDSEHGRFPRRPLGNTAPTAVNLLKQNDIGWVYAGLRNRAAIKYGGGQGSPYLEWKPENVGYVTNPDPANGDDASDAGNPPPYNAGMLDAANFDSLNDASFQATVLPAASSTPAKCLAFLDPWQSPYFYREWASIQEATKGTASAAKTSKTDTGGGTTSVTDRLHERTRFEIWSWGPNAANEWGDGDDVTSWKQN